jgi:hypothetical protein
MSRNIIVHRPKLAAREAKLAAALAERERERVEEAKVWDALFAEEAKRTKAKARQPVGPQHDAHVELLRRIRAQIAEFNDANFGKSLERYGSVLDSQIFNALTKKFRPKGRWQHASDDPVENWLIEAFTIRIVAFWKAQSCLVEQITPSGWAR